jgi:hypothetical protein
MIIIESNEKEHQMTKKTPVQNVGRIFGWVAAGLLLITLLTGYGITEFRAVTPWTLGLLTKPVAQRLHSQTELLLMASLLVHVGIAVWVRRIGNTKKEVAKHE